ncbi:ABC transporter ATP-binding protein [Limibaculum sp. M0105]|uniref:ABC transporter ATP-binding protein n=1 Tax=Thermohalobaculum xanthum TaxID=2753746 RepID=A0A8J7SE65_9RHOB|nr:ABC transporter ATP-binding protein [Thermohalobaculum xanthum]MBK0399301.1 ABC transporter ATP-binding protein [Thermohalobaculum xanthum]
MRQTPLLKVEGLSICFGLPGASIEVVHDVSFELAPGRTLALVGESGSGKTLTGKAVMGLLPRGARVSAGRVLLQRPDGPVDLLRQSPAVMRQIRGAQVSMIFQEPMSAFSALHTVGSQISEVLRVHGMCDAAEARKRALDMLAEVGCPDAARAYAAYPFELSGGLRQRAMIAMAMIGAPRLVIADEPTTALDVTTQAVVLDLLRRVSRDHGLATVLITHDLGVVANMADEVVVLRRGMVVERGEASAVLTHPGHSYTKRLIDAAPRVPESIAVHAPPERDDILTVDGLSKTYPGRHRSFGRPASPVYALSDFSMRLERGRTVAVVGESGSGKSTVAKLILRAELPDPGATIRFNPRDGQPMDVTSLAGERLTEFRRKAQMVFQDPFAALSPRMSVQDILTEPLVIHGLGTRSERRERAAWLMARVGLSPDHLGRFPHAFSGGQRQRIAIARALALKPELLVLDEPTSALDVSVQAEVLELMGELEGELGLSYLFISHNLAVVAALADHVMVMRRGRVVEEGAPDCIFNDPRHPYTRALIAASPEPDMHRRLDLTAVACGAGEPNTWPEPFGYNGEAAPQLIEVAPGHRVRRAA